MKKLFGLLLVFISLTCYAQVPALNEIVKTNTLSPSRVGAALEASEVYTASGTDTYTVSISVTGLYSGSATYAAGDQFTIIFPNANATTTPTLNINTEGAITIVDNKGNAVAAGDVEGILKLSYDGTNFRIVGGTGSGGGGGVTSVSGTSNRITSSGGTTPAIDIAATYVGQSSITTTGTLTSGATGTGYTLSFTNSTLSGRIAEANIPATYVYNKQTPSTAGGTITLNCNNAMFSKFLPGATFATSKTIAMSNTTNAESFVFFFEITDVAASLIVPADWEFAAEPNFNGTTWTPSQTGEFVLGGDWTGTVWNIKISGPSN